MAYESESLLVNGDPNDSKQSANLIDLGDWMYGSLASVDDVDYFKFTLETAGLLKLSFTGGSRRALQPAGRSICLMRIWISQRLLCPLLQAI